MSGPVLALILVQGALFLVWAFMMFRTLFLLAGRARRASGRSFPGVGATLHAWKLWLTSPEDRSKRLQLGGVTLGLFALTGAGMALPR